MQQYFDETISIISNALNSVDQLRYGNLISECETTIKSGNKIIATGLGKNVPICDKFVGTMLSLGLNMVKPGDLVIILTKSGATAESVYLEALLEKRKQVKLWLISFDENGILSKKMENKVIVNMTHEGDLWNIVPNNSTTINLILLQTVAMELSKRLNLSLENDFKPNHPGGAIGVALNHE